MAIDYQLRSSVAVVTMDDGKANALGHPELEALVSALDRSEADGARAVLLAGRPGRFCAGFDLAVMRQGGAEMRSLVGHGARATVRLLLHPAPVVAACTGHALALGALLLLAADQRVGTAGDFRVGLNEVAIGMPMPRWGVELASYRLSPRELQRRLLLGRTATPEEAVAAGFLDSVVDGDTVAAAMAVAEELSELRTGAVAGTKLRLRGEVARRMLEDLEGDLQSVSIG